MGFAERSWSKAAVVNEVATNISTSSSGSDAVLDEVNLRDKSVGSGRIDPHFFFGSLAHFSLLYTQGDVVGVY